MTITNPFIARLAGEPVLIEASAAERVHVLLDGMVAHEAAEIVMNSPAMAGDDFWTELGDNRYASILRPYVVKDGILQIPVKGMLLHNFAYSFFDYATGYIYVQKAFERGMADENVKGIALMIDSPGGMVAGCFDAVDKMVAAKNGKPVRAFAHESAYSAAYAVATVADHVVVSRTGGVGSVGVVTMHIDASEQLKARGLKVTYIFAGKHKVDGNSTQPLSDETKARIQARIDESYSVFVSAVARGRNMEEQAVRDTEALTFTATQAVSNGMADSIGSLDDAVAAFAAVLDDQSDNKKEDEMADANQSAPVAQADVENARTEGLTAGRGEGAAAERTRIAAILASDEAKDRPAFANHIAMNTSMSVEDAKAMLAAAAKEAADTTGTETATGTGFTNAMDSTANPNVGGGNGGGGNESAAAEDGSDVVALAALVGLKGFAKA